MLEDIKEEKIPFKIGKYKINNLNINIQKFIDKHLKVSSYNVLLSEEISIHIFPYPLSQI